jgi:hypothetical protein
LVLLALRRSGNVCVQSGYKTITPAECASLVYALNEKRISYRAVRVYFACLSLIAIREAAKRSSKRVTGNAREKQRYRVAELCSLTSLPEETIRRELRSLARSGILSFSESSIAILCASHAGDTDLSMALAGKRSCKRPVPVPRSVLRLLARSQKAALGKTILAYLLRGMAIDRTSGEVRGVGTVKASWIAEVMKVSLRSVKAARKELIALGFITKDTGSVQRKLNRDGAYFRINLAWGGRPGGVASRSKQSVTGRGQRVAKAGIAHRGVRNSPAFAPPMEEKKTPYGSKDQKAWTAKPSGVSSKPERAGEPNLRNVQREDLMSYSRTESLYRQAVKASWVKDSEASLLNWVSAAVRAKSCRARDPVRVFVGIVKRGLWSHITDADEERARRAIVRYRDQARDGAGPSRSEEILLRRLALPRATSPR